MNVAAKSKLMMEQSAVITKADGCEIDLGVITSPYNDKLRNWFWKKRKEAWTRKVIAAHDRHHSPEGV